MTTSRNAANNKHITTAALLAIAAGLGAPVLEMGEVRRRQAETDEERQAREMIGIDELNRRKRLAEEKMRRAAEKRERRAAKRRAQMGNRDHLLRNYVVALKQEPSDDFTILFECQAENEDHAKEQAENAYPGCESVVAEFKLEI